jgi:transposase
VRLVRDSGKSVGAVGAELDLTETALRDWVRQAEIDAGRGAPGALTTEEREELGRLRRENRTLRMERDIHHGLAKQRVAARATVLATAYAAHPERFSAGPPAPTAMPTEVWINPPKRSALQEVALTH